MPSTPRTHTPHRLVCIWRAKRTKAFFKALEHSCHHFITRPWRRLDPTKLHVAIKEGDINTVKHLLRAKRRLVYARDQNGRTALHWTVVLGSQMCTRFVLKHTPWWILDRCDYNGCTPLHYACQADRSEEARLLLVNGAYVNARDDRGRTPAHYAALNGNPFIIHKLRSHGANLWIKDMDGHLSIDLTENQEVMELLNRMMDWNFICFRLFTGRLSKGQRPMDDVDRYPYHEDGNPVKRYLPKNMLEQKMSADGVRNKHSLVHRELERKMWSQMDPDATADAKKRAVDELLLRMRVMKEEDRERERRLQLQGNPERGL